MAKELTAYFLSIPAFYAVASIVPWIFMGLGYLALRSTPQAIFMRATHVPPLLLRLPLLASYAAGSYASFISIYIVFQILEQQTTFFMFIIPLALMLRNGRHRISSVDPGPERGRSFPLIWSRRLELIADVTGFLLALYFVPDEWRVWANNSVAL